MLQIFLICTPFEMDWNPTLPGGRCASYNVAFVTIGIFTLIHRSDHHATTHPFSPQDKNGNRNQDRSRHYHQYRALVSTRS
jgi:hypothetical protein